MHLNLAGIGTLNMQAYRPEHCCRSPGSSPPRQISTTGTDQRRAAHGMIAIDVDTKVPDAQQWSDRNAVNHHCCCRQLMLAATCCTSEDFGLFGFYCSPLEFIQAAMSSACLQNWSMNASTAGGGHELVYHPYTDEVVVHDFKSKISGPCCTTEI